MRGVMVLGMQREGLDSEYTVTSSSSYSKSSEIKAGSSEVRGFPGIGFSSCTAPTFGRVQGISNGGTNRVSGMCQNGMCTGTIPSMSTKTREAEVRSTYSLEVRGMCEVEFSLSEESSRARQDMSRVRYSECRNIHDTGTYILNETKSGMHEE